MKSIILFFFCSFFTFITANAQNSTANKYALIVAIGDYPESGGWGKISGNKDVPYVQNVLKKQQFESQNIAILVDSIATRKNIESQLSQLIDKVHTGDVVLIHFSCHGEQIEDDNGDEVDGLDEAIVAYDAISPRKSDNFAKDTFGYLRDDVFGQYIKKLRGKLGANGDVVVFMDACHSGSGTRGSMKTRGGEKPLVSKNYIPKIQSNNGNVFQESDFSGPELATYVVFSAARAEELAFEVLGDNRESMGSLTYAVAKVMEQVEAGSSYRSFFAKLQAVMNAKVPGQHPVMEGNGIDRVLFGGNYIYQKNYVPVSKIKSENTLELEAGLFAGLDKGAKVVLCASGTAEPSANNILDSGVVIWSNSWNSVVRMKKKYTSKSIAYWAFVYEPIYSMDSIVLGLNMAKGKTPGYTVTEAEYIQQLLAQQTLVQFTGIPQLQLAKGLAADSLLVSGNGFLFATIKKDADYASNLKQYITQFAQYRFLQNLILKDSQFQLQVELVPIVDGIVDTSAIQKHWNNGTRFYKEGDAFTIRATNTSNKALYLNIIELQPDGWMNPVMPNREAGVYASDLAIAPGQTRIFGDYVIEIGPPFGTNIYKLFISKKQIDLENLVAMRGQGQSRAGFGVLENAFQTGLDAGTARGSNLTVKTANAEGCVQDLIFEIVPFEQ